MNLKSEVKLNPFTNKVLHYPWKEILPGDSMEMICPSSFTARQMAYRYAKRNGWEIETAIGGKNVIMIYRKK